MIVESLNELASEQIQKARWMSGGSEMSSFIEAVEQLFTDSGLEDALRKGETGYPNEVDFLLKQLDQLISKIDGGRTPDEIINDPSMQEIRNKSREILYMLGA